MASMYRWVILLAFFFPMGSLAAFIVDDFTKPALACEPFLLQWQEGIAPWTLRSVLVLQASDSAILENLGTFGVTSFNWNVDLAAGTSVQTQLQNSTGATAISKTLTIQPGTTDCTLRTVGAQQTSTTQGTAVITSTTRTTPPAQTMSTRALTTSSATLYNQLDTNDQLDVTNILHHLIVNARCVGPVFVFGNRKPIQ
ncbi:hypothetical protein DFH08DRAFT_1084979 [Mycena albidolilacea]|uniref:Uncharacterized protein n=1 Tax=Mycena albidolilacea TaxID=1033008 RepID=A0AAD6ZJZ2_9AGAR|nr:hypothetical protein DFH08DRAFT_1084979 [Mycena albidolilacea]